ncbi:hypothetical protein [Enterococcus xiangfangensis]|uniref:hypothetical protein n=1 Tax=Enterococcus xiangfangensis TaxID=1296537 RepID=UPI00142E1C7A|nr:hypothetical protein [Enterococcus xiangfangensis]MBM7710627.1 hypothetical protein [Enterococcus xiangfangensis]
MTSQQVMIAKEILKNYRQLARLTGKFLSMIELEKLTICNASIAIPDTALQTLEQFESERQAIIQAWQLLCAKERTTLFYAYLCKEPMTMQQIAATMKYSKKSVEKWKNQVSKNFLKRYKNGVMVE